MRIEKTFTPVKILIENETEANIIQSIGKLNVTIPDILRDSRFTKEEVEIVLDKLSKIKE